MSDQTVIPLPLWRHPRRTGLLLMVLGVLVVILAIGLIEGSHELQDALSAPLPPPPAPAPSPSSSSPTST